jgi:hypothetical protein
MPKTCRQQGTAFSRTFRARNFQASMVNSRGLFTVTSFSSHTKTAWQISQGYNLADCVLQLVIYLFHDHRHVCDMDWWTRTHSLALNGFFFLFCGIPNLVWIGKSENNSCWKRHATDWSDLPTENTRQRPVSEVQCTYGTDHWPVCHALMHALSFRTPPTSQK